MEESEKLKSGADLKKRLSGLVEKEMKAKDIRVLCQPIVHDIIHSVDKRWNEKNPKNRKERVIAKAEHESEKEEGEVTGEPNARKKVQAK